MRLMTANRLRTGVLALMAMALGGHVASGQGAPPQEVHAPTCAKALIAYSSIAAVPSPHDTLTIPPLSGSWNSAAAMAAARLDGIAKTGATGYVVETKAVSEPGSPVSRTMSRCVPVFVPGEEAKARAACAVPDSKPEKPGAAR